MTNLGLGDQGLVVCWPLGFLLSYHVQNSSGVHPASSLMSVGVSFTFTEADGLHPFNVVWSGSCWSLLRCLINVFMVCSCRWTI